MKVFCVGVILYMTCAVQALNDYVVGYHDAVLLFGRVMRDNLLAIENQTSSGIIQNPFRSTRFQGINVSLTLHLKHTEVIQS